LWPIRRALTVASVTAVTGLVVVMIAVLGFPHLQHTKALPIGRCLGSGAVIGMLRCG
jgi:hypothetical protein